jgi:hypothetical protein
VSVVPSGCMGNDLELMLLAEQAGHVVSRRQVRGLGISDDRWNRMVDQGWWLSVTPVHWRPAGVHPTLATLVRVGDEWLGRPSALFGSSALWWWGVDVAAPTTIEFLVPRARRSVVPWMTLHTTTRWNDRDVVRHPRIRTSVGARAIIDLATIERSARVLEEAIDSAIRGRRTAMSRLRSSLSDLSGKGRHGCPLLRELLLDSGGESFLERRFLRLMRENGFPRPLTQAVFRGAGDRVVRVDFLFDGVVVEVTGRLGHASDRDRQKDARRRNLLQQKGLTVLEFTTADVIDDPTHVLTTLHKSLSSSHREPRARRPRM